MPLSPTYEHTDLAWRFLLRTRSMLRPDTDAEGRRIVRKTSFQHVNDPKLALVVLFIARMNDATPDKLVTRQMVRTAGLPSAAVDHAFNLLLHELPPVGADPDGIAFHHGKVGRATGLRIKAVTPASPL